MVRTWPHAGIVGAPADNMSETTLAPLPWGYGSVRTPRRGRLGLCRPTRLTPSRGVAQVPIAPTPVSSRGGGAEDTEKALEAARTEIMELRKQLGLPDTPAALAPPLVPAPAESRGGHGFTPAPGAPRTISAASSVCSAVSSPLPPPKTAETALSSPPSTASSMWSERSALIRASFKPTQQLFEQRSQSPRQVQLTRGGRTRVVPPRRVTSVTHFVRRSGTDPFGGNEAGRPWGHGYCP